MAVQHASHQVKTLNINYRKNLKYKLPKKPYGEFEKLSEPGQEIQLDITGETTSQIVNYEVQTLIAVDRLGKRPTVKNCKTAETSMKLTSFVAFLNCKEDPRNLNPIKLEISFATNFVNLAKAEIFEIEYCTSRMHEGNGAVERVLQTLKNLIIANLGDSISLTEGVIQALRVVQFTIHTGLKLTPFELHHGRNPRTELPNIVKDGKSCLPNLSELFQHQIDPKYPYDGKGDIINHFLMA